MIAKMKRMVGRTSKPGLFAYLAVLISVLGMFAGLEAVFSHCAKTVLHPRSDGAAQRTIADLFEN